MEIVIACGAMPFGPATLESQSLGGSETAALMVAKELAKRKHNVKLFCNLPPNSRPDYWPGGKADDGVIYVPGWLPGNSTKLASQRSPRT